MSERIASALDKLKATSAIPDPWKGSRYGWFKELSGAEAGKLGERLVKAVLGGESVGRSTGYDIRLASGRRVEVKLCRRSYSVGNVWSWKQIRREDEYDDLCLVAIDPEDARLFLVPRDQIPESALSNQHGRDGDGALSQIAWPKAVLPEWILRHEVK